MNPTNQKIYYLIASAAMAVSGSYLMGPIEGVFIEAMSSQPLIGLILGPAVPSMVGMILGIWWLKKFIKAVSIKEIFLISGIAALVRTLPFMTSTFIGFVTISAGASLQASFPIGDMLLQNFQGLLGGFVSGLLGGLIAYRLFKNETDNKKPANKKIQRMLKRGKSSRI